MRGDGQLAGDPCIEQVSPLNTKSRMAVANYHVGDVVYGWLWLKWLG